MKKHQHNPNLTPNAKRLRKQMTAEERKLWFLCLREFPTRFLRQKVIDDYIVDFYCAKVKLAIELDGSQHYSDFNEKYDCIRTENLQKRGILVLRFTNREINTEFEAVCAYIYKIVSERLKRQ